MSIQYIITIINFTIKFLFHSLKFQIFESSIHEKKNKENPIQELTLLVYLAISAATSAEAVAIGKSVLTEEESVFADPELVTIEIG